jgi:hypothetical protein
MKMKKIFLLFVISILAFEYFGCTSVQNNNSKKENLDSLIIAHHKDILFLDYWFGMTRSQYKIVTENLINKGKLVNKMIIKGKYYRANRGKEIIIEKKNEVDTLYKDTYLFNTKSSTISAYLTPYFINDSLKELVLSFDPDHRYLYNEEEKCYNSIDPILNNPRDPVEEGDELLPHIDSYSSTDTLLALYLEKFSNYEKYIFSGGVEEYAITDSSRYIIFHYQYSYQSILYQSLFKFNRKHDLKKEKIYNDIYIKYANYNNHFRTIDNDEAVQKKQKLDDEKKIEKNNKQRDSIVKKTKNDL